MRTSVSHQDKDFIKMIVCQQSVQQNACSRFHLTEDKVLMKWANDTNHEMS